MSKVAVVTDSTSCIPLDLLKKYDIRVGLYHIIMEGMDYRDLIDITPAEFWSRFKTLKRLPTTAVLGPGEYIEIFNDLTKALSGAYESSSRAKEIFQIDHPDVNIEIVDSKNSGGALGFVVLEAARAAEAGKKINDVTQAALDMVPRVKLLIALDTLKYLIIVGRAPKIAFIGELLRLKPIIGLMGDSGLVDSLGNARGKARAMQKLVELVKEHADITGPLHVMVHYTDNIEDGKRLRDIVTSTYNCAEIHMTDFTPVMTTHTGPSLAISFYS
ncbi:MAG: DegV family protein [Dehalococcoidia bacterium]